jgi:GNAT superfamily N-acetyltransferase
LIHMTGAISSCPKPAIWCRTRERLAVDASFKGQGLGGALLADALLRCKRSDIAAYALIVDAKDDSACAFYRHHGFIALPEAALTLFLPLASVPFQT